MSNVLDDIRDEKLIKGDNLNYEELNYNDGYEKGFDAAIEVMDKYLIWQKEEYDCDWSVNSKDFNYWLTNIYTKP